MTPTQVAELKRQFIEKRQLVLKRKVTSLESKLYDKILRDLILQLETSGGKIISNNKNIDLTSALDKLFKSFNENEYFDVIRSFGNDLGRVSKLNEQYFEVIESDRKKMAKVSREVNQVMRKRIGLNTKGDVVKDGYLDRLVTDSTLRARVKQQTYKAITSGQDVTSFIEKMKTIVVGDDKVNGALVKHFNQFAFDTFNQFERASGKMYATKLGLKAFIFGGGVIKSTRCFCKKNNGKVFTNEEAEKWSGMINETCGPIWSDKEGVYDPISDLGGHGCRHTANWISNSMAIRLRPDLKGELEG